MNQAERRVENEIVFREANERIEQSARRFALGGSVPFICECGDESCRELIHLSAEEYEQVRSRGSRFLVVRGHEVEGDEEIVEDGGPYVIVEKTGPGKGLAAQADRRRHG